MTEPLTREQVAIIKTARWTSQLSSPGVDALCDSHEALRAQLVKANEEIRALGEAMQAITRGEGPYNRYHDLYLQGVVDFGIQIAEEALARPGVKAVMADSKAGQVSPAP